MDIAEKRVYTEDAGRTRLAVGTGAGLAVVGISGDVIGEFGLAVRGSVRDLAVAGEHSLLVATGEDVHLVDLGPDDGGIAETERVEELDVGEADAVTVHDASIVAAGSDGVVRSAALATVVEDGGADPGWTSLGDVEAVRAADGQLLAAADGVYRVGAFDVVGAAYGTDASEPRAHAAAGSRLHERRTAAAGSRTGSEADTGGWSEVEVPTDAPIAGVAYDPASDERHPYAVTVDGTVLADDGDGWRTRSIGLPDVIGCVVVA